MLDESAVFQILLPARNHVTAFLKLGTCEIAISKRLFELLSGLNFVSRLPLLDFLGDRGQFVA